MSQILKIVGHLDNDALMAALKAEKRARIRNRIQIVWLMQTRGLSTGAAAELVGLSQPTAARWAGVYNEKGLEALEGRQAGQRPNEKVTTEMRAQLTEWFAEDPPEDVHGGLWDGPKVAAIVESRWGVVITRQTGWLILRQSGYTPQTMRPRHTRTSDEDREEFKKNASGGSRYHKIRHGR